MIGITGSNDERRGSQRGTGRTMRPLLRAEALEPRLLLAAPGDIVPGQLYSKVAFHDANGDTVEVEVLGTLGGAAGFTISLSGGAVNDADVDTINLIGLTSANSLVVRVTPNELTINAGPDYNRMFSAGFTNVNFIRAVADPAHVAPEVTGLGGIQLSAAIVNSIALPGVDIGNITLDTGMVAYVDRVNTTNPGGVNVSAPVVNAGAGAVLTEVVDESPTGPTSNYNPTMGLIDLGSVTARNIESLLIEGGVSALTNDEYDTTELSNDFRGIISVSESIGSVIGPRSALRGALRAASIGSVRVGKISGEITTSDPSAAFAINLPNEFDGFINSAGHLHLGFPMLPEPEPTTTGEAAALLNGRIMAGGGISGSVRDSLSDSLYIPSNYAGVMINTSPMAGIADIAINGVGALRLISASSIGNIAADSFTTTFIVEAGTDIGNVEAYKLALEGHL